MTGGPPAWSMPDFGSRVGVDLAGWLRSALPQPEDKLPLRFHPRDGSALTLLEEGSLTVTIREIREG